MLYSIQESVIVSLSRHHAFFLFVEDVSHWWPRRFSWSQDKLVRMIIEPRVAGRCTEIGPLGFRCDWGRVLEYAPPSRLVFSWQIGPGAIPEPDPDRSSTVYVHFTAIGSVNTYVKVRHDGFDRHGRRGEDCRRVMLSEHGWPLILRRYREAASGARSGESGPRPEAARTVPIFETARQDVAGPSAREEESPVEIHVEARADVGSNRHIQTQRHRVRTGYGNAE